MNAFLADGRLSSCQSLIHLVAFYVHRYLIKVLTETKNQSQSSDSVKFPRGSSRRGEVFPWTPSIKRVDMQVDMQGHVLSKTPEQVMVKCCERPQALEA